MTTITIVILLIVFLLGALLGIGLAQAAGKEMPKPTRKINQIKGVNPIDKEAIRQAIKDADERELWDE